MIGHDEANLTGLPVTRTHRQDDRSKIERTWTMKGRNGEEREFYRIIKSQSQSLLPGQTADRVLNALSCLTARQGRVMKTSYPELASLAGLEPSGRNYDLIYRALDRLQDVMIETNSIWLHDRQQYVQEAQLYLIGAQAKVPEPSGKTEVRIAWTNEFYGMIQSWTKPINIQSINDLSSPIARRLYRLSELAFFHEGRFVEDLHILAHIQLGLSKNRTAPSHIKQSLKGAVKSIQDKGLARVEYIETDSLRSGHGIYVSPGPKMYELEMSIDDPRYWAAQIAMRGVQSKRENAVEECRDLVSQNRIPFVKKCVKGYDIRRQGDENLRAAEGPGWLYDALRREFKFDPYEPDQEEPHVGAEGAPALPANNYEQPSAIESEDTGLSKFCSLVHEHLHLDTSVDREQLHSEASDMMEEEVGGEISLWLSKRDGKASKENVERIYLVRAYLQRHGLESLPETISQSAPEDLSQLGL